MVKDHDLYNKKEISLKKNNLAKESNKIIEL